MIIYDRDRPRPYTTSEFPSALVDVLDPVLVGAGYVYSVHRADTFNPVPCVTRHPIDALGFGPPQDFCNPAFEWGKYPEMKSYGSALVLESRTAAAGILAQPDPAGNMRSLVNYDNSRNLAYLTVTLSFDFNTHLATYREAFSRMDTGAPVGHYPARTVFKSPEIDSGKLTPVEVTSFVIVDDDTAVYLERRGGPFNLAAILTNWQAAIERDP